MVRFTKMEGCGNNYIFIINHEEQVPEAEFPALARAISDRNFGVGADGLIVLLPPRDSRHDLRFRMFNLDGSEGEMCGNGIRCFARLAWDRGLVRREEMRVDTPAGTIVPRLVLDGGRFRGVRVDMGPPQLKSTRIPVAGPEREPVLGETLEVAGRRWTFTAVSMGNPHAVVFTDRPEELLTGIGPAFEHHPLFPRRVNTHFAQVLDREHIRVVHWERGSGATLACGTGCCATLVAAHLSGLTGRRATLHAPGGDLLIEWGEDGHVYMTGPAEYVCEGVFHKSWK